VPDGCLFGAGRDDLVFASELPRQQGLVSTTEDARAWWALPTSIQARGEVYINHPFSAAFIWRRKHRVKSDGDVDYSDINLKGTRLPGRISYNAQWASKIPWNALFLGWAEICRPQVALMHAFIGDDAVNSQKRNDFQRLELNAVWDPVLPGIPYAIALEQKHLPAEKCARLRDAGCEVHEFDTFAVVFLMASPEMPSQDPALFATRQRAFETITGLSAGSKLGRLGR